MGRSRFLEREGRCGVPGRQGQMSREGHPVWRKEVETESREKTSEPRRDAGRVLPASANATCPLRLLLVYIWGHGHTFSNITDVVSKAQTVAPCGLCPGTTPRSLAACLDHRVCGPGSSWPRCGHTSLVPVKDPVVSSDPKELLLLVLHCLRVGGSMGPSAPPCDPPPSSKANSLSPPTLA